MRKPPIVEVTWEDAFNSSRWLRESEVNEWHGLGATCTTLGYLFKRDQRGVTLVQSLSPQEFGATWFIPKRMIKKLRRLK